MDKDVQQFFRSAELDFDTYNETENTIEISFSSETPYLRSQGWEILGHSTDDADFTWADSGNCPFLIDHNAYEASSHIGVVERAWIENKRGKAIIRFSGDEEKQGIINDIKHGIRPNISFGYERWGQTLVGQIEGVEAYKYKFKVFEISSVSIPADMTVGTNRSIEPIENNISARSTHIMEDTNKTQDTVNVEAIRSAAIKEAQTRAVEISTLCREWNFADKAEEFIKSEKTLLDIKAEVFAEVEKRNSTSKQSQSQPINMFNIGSSEQPTFDAGKAFRAATRQNWKGAEFEFDECQKRADESNGLIRHDKNVVILNPNAQVRATQAGPVTAGTSGTGGALVGVDYHPERLIDALWNKTFLNKVGTDEMLGLTGNASFPVISSNATTSWVTETGALPAAQGLATSLKQISPKEMVAKFSMTRQSLIQDVPNVQVKVLDQLYEAIAQALDSAALNGVVSPALSTTGLLNEIIGGNLSVQGTNGLAPSLAALTKLRKLAVNNKIDVDRMKWLISSSMRETLSVTLKDSANTNSGYILNDGAQTFAGLPYIASQNVPFGVTKGTSTAGSNGGVSNVILGKWDDLLVAQWGNIAVEFDYVTGADTSLVNIRAFSFWDIIIKRLESFYMVPDFIG